MKHFTGYELLWLFFVYSFLGWVLETAATTLKQRKFSNRGLVNGPFCVIYGITAVLMSVGLQELKGIWLFVFAAVYATVAEWISGHLIEKIFHERWWDYSNDIGNINGRISIAYSLAWGAIGLIFNEKIHPFIEAKLDKAKSKISYELQKIIVIILPIAILTDFILSSIKYLT